MGAETWDVRHKFLELSVGSGTEHHKLSKPVSSRRKQNWNFGAERGTRKLRRKAEAGVKHVRHRKASLEKVPKKTYVNIVG